MLMESEGIACPTDYQTSPFSDQHTGQELIDAKHYIRG